MARGGQLKSNHPNQSIVNTRSRCSHPNGMTSPKTSPQCVHWECINGTRTILQQVLATPMRSASPTMTPFLRAAFYERRWVFLAMMEAHTLRPAPWNSLPAAMVPDAPHFSAIARASQAIPPQNGFCGVSCSLRRLGSTPRTGRYPKSPHAFITMTSGCSVRHTGSISGALRKMPKSST